MQTLRVHVGSVHGRHTVGSGGRDRTERDRKEPAAGRFE